MIATVAPWALAAGMPEPGPDEQFEDYWSRVGVPDDAIAAALFGLPERALCVAHDRMNAYLRRTMPDAFDRYVEGRAARFRRNGVGSRS